MSRGVRATTLDTRTHSDNARWQPEIWEGHFCKIRFSYFLLAHFLSGSKFDFIWSMEFNYISRFIGERRFGFVNIMMNCLEWQSINQSIEQPIEQPIDQSINQSIKQSSKMLFSSPWLTVLLSLSLSSHLIHPSVPHFSNNLYSRYPWNIFSTKYDSK